MIFALIIININNPIVFLSFGWLLFASIERECVCVYIVCVYVHGVCVCVFVHVVYVWMCYYIMISICYYCEIGSA